MLVAPYVGAWIETTSSMSYIRGNTSHPTWVRGLKPVLSVLLLKLVRSHPTWVRGLKPFWYRIETTNIRSEERRVGKECRSRWSPYH